MFLLSVILCLRLIYACDTIHITHTHTHRHNLYVFEFNLGVYANI